MCNNGPTILKIIFDAINPSTEIGTDRLCKTIQNCSLAKHDYNGIKAFDKVEHAYKQIMLHNETNF